jgi:hypothetical protein
MSDVTTDTSSPANGGAATTEGEPAAPATETPSATAIASAKMREAIGVLKEHPLRAVATVAAATALIEVELAVGILAGLGATALLATKSGPEARQQVLERGKWVYARARSAIVSRRKTKPPTADASPPPA